MDRAPTLTRALRLSLTQVNMDRELGLLDNMVSETSCGKMRAVVALLRTFKAKKQKVLLFSYSTQMLDILEAMVLRKGDI